MRGLGVLDILIIVAVLAALLLAARRDFIRYDTRTLPQAVTATPAT